MALAIGTLAPLINWVVRLIPSSGNINFIELHLLIKSYHCLIDSSPEGSIACIWLKFMIVSEQSRVANNTMVKASWHLVPQFASEWSFKCFIVDEVLLIRRQRYWGGLLIDVWNRLGRSSWIFGSIDQSLFIGEFVDDREGVQKSS